MSLLSYDTMRKAGENADRIKELYAKVTELNGDVLTLIGQLNQLKDRVASLERNLYGATKED